VSRSVDSYIEETVEPLIQMCEAKGKIAKYRYRGLQISMIIVSSSIPVVSAIAAGDTLKWTTAILGAVIAATTSLIQMFKYLEEWLLYNNIGTSISSELRLYQQCAGEYSKQPDLAGKSKLFVERIEAKIGELQTKLSSAHSKQQLAKFGARIERRSKSTPQNEEGNSN